eukprot:TRINITY_DN17907_c0_g1_i1.p1 TRINITY_DN17907_c0_g1~~TRINITY_DN17907_c0_g1_i1.p1  ORF type:complete len:500 (+),score=59.12 TRINITY_DN17907_c0_g1_i1:88-1587(+)
MFQLLLGAAVATALKTDIAPVGCPTGFSNDIPGMCTSKLTLKLGWYSAEAECRGLGGHLATFEDEGTLKQLFQKFDPTEMWIGLSSASGVWKWSDGTKTSQAEAAGILPAMKTPDAACAVARRATDGGVTISSEPCSSIFSLVCSTGTESCVWKNRELFFEGGLLPGSNLILPSNVLVQDGTEIGLGDWVTPNTFSVSNVVINGKLCTYLVVFHQDRIVDGCQGPDNGVIVDPHKVSFKEPVNCTTTPSSHESVMFIPTPPPHNNNGLIPDNKENSRVAVTDSPGGKPGGSDIMMTPTPSGLGMLRPSEGDSIPKWIWPVALVTAVVVSAVAAVGAANRRGRRKGSGNSGSASSGSSGEVMMTKIGPDGDSGPDVVIDDDERPGITGITLTPDACVPPDRPCEACQKFSQTRARQRLLNVYRSLASELALPLVIKNITCVHQAKEHIHLFEVENEFSSHTLQSLSTLYSRTKPRPRATRIHIEPRTKLMETEFDDGGYM